MSPMAARARNGALIGGRRRELQEFAQRSCPSVVHGRAHRHLDSLQIEAARFAASTKDDAQELIYVVRDCLKDRFGRFFSCSVCSVSSTGRKRQIFRLTSTKLLVSV